MSRTSYHRNRKGRRGAAAVFVAVSVTALVGVAALAIDVGVLYNARSELQRAADASALAGAEKLLDLDRLKGTGMGNVADDLAAAAQEARTFASRNKILNVNPGVLDSDITIGFLRNPSNLSEPIDTSDPSLFNTVQIKLRRDSSSNGSISLFFGRIFGLQSKDMSSQAAATYSDGVIGYKVTDKSGNADLLPLALHVNAWRNLINRAGTVYDNYSYDNDSKTVSGGSDGVPELNLYPGAGPTQLPPGNYGTVDIGNPNNSTADLSRQIRQGVSKEDLAWFGGTLKLGPDGTLMLNGDTGLSAGIKDDLASIIGKPRAIPLFRQVTGNGNNSMFTVVGFAGIRILNVKLTGAMNSKQVVIQPAYVVDDAVITGNNNGPSYYVYQPVHLSR